jgi:hypothetical protein
MYEYPSRSPEYRKRAAQHLRMARRCKDAEEKRGHLGLARGFKSLAAVDEWLSGEKPKSDDLASRGREPAGSLAPSGKTSV